MKGIHALKTRCPECGHACDSAGSVTTPAAPQPGDLSVCIRCATISQYDDQMSLARVPDEAIGDPEYANALELRAKVLELRRMH